MKKFFKWTGILLLSVLVIALISAFLIIRNFDNRAAQKHKITPENLIIPTDSLSLERGKELAVICTDCHTSDLGGKLFFTDPQLGSVYTANNCLFKNHTSCKSRSKTNPIETISQNNSLFGWFW